MKTLIALLFASAVSACNARPHLALYLPPEIDAGSAILELVGENKTHLFAADVKTGVDFGTEFEDGESVRVSVLLYPFSLDELQLDPGTLPIAGEEPSRALPKPASFIRAETRFGEPADAFWSEDSFAESDLATLRIRETTRTCSMERGCSSSAPDDDGSVLCLSACKAPQTIEPPTPPAEPMAPESPVLLPCPVGWLEVPASDPNDVASCAPPQIMEICALGASFYGETTCSVLGDPCPNGIFPVDPPPGAVFVDANAPGGGDGTSARPFSTLGEALGSTPLGGTIILGRGVHTASVTIERALTLRGACTTQTEIIGRLHISGDDVAIDNLAFESDRDPIIVGVNVARASLRDVVINNVRTAVLVGTGAELSIDGLYILGADTGIVAEPSSILSMTRANISDVRIGLDADRAFVTVASSVFLRARQEAIGSIGGGSLDARGLIIVAGDSAASYGIRAQSVAVGLERAQIEMGAGYGLTITHGGVGVVEDVVIRGRGSNVVLGSGMAIGGDTAVDIGQISIAGFSARGIEIQRAHKTRIHDAVIRNLGPDAIAISVDTATTAEVSRILVLGPAMRAFEVNEGASLAVTHAVVRDLAPEHGSFAIGLSVGARAVVERADLTNAGAIAFTNQAGSRLELIDFAARGQHDGDAGYAQCGRLIITRGRFLGMRSGVSNDRASGDCPLETHFTDVRIGDAGDPVEQGLRSQSGRLTMERVAIEGGTERPALEVGGEEARLSDLELRGSIMFTPVRALSLTRAAIRFETRTAITLDATRGVFIDLDIRGKDEEPSVQQTALALSTTSSITVAHFAFRAPGMSGVLFRDEGDFGGGLALHDGVIAHAYAAIIAAPRIRPQLHLQDLRVDSVERVVFSPP